MNLFQKIFCCTFLLIIFGMGVNAQIRLPKIICDNMVLQMEQPVPIWGWSNAGDKIAVSFSDQTKNTIADSSGLWKIVLEPLKASDKPAEMVINNAKSTIKLTNILVGEVWLCGGQSNMEYTMRLMPNYKAPYRNPNIMQQELATANNKNIRIFLVQKKLSPIDVTTTGWNIAKDSALMAFSTVGYFFGKEINQALNVPIGIISSSWGGTRIEPWTPAESYFVSPYFKNDIAPKTGIIDGIAAGNLYKRMILPLAPFAIRGFLWYQGESNCMLNETTRYTEKMKVLINSWRNVWGKADLPFYYVQIAPFYYTKRKDKMPHTNETLPEFWEAQTNALSIPFTGMAVITDLVDNLAEIHPSYKWEVAKRLSLWALAKDYNKKDLEYSGPIFEKMEVRKNKIKLFFTHTGGKLVYANKLPVTWFSISGEDGVFYPADAVISGANVIVSSQKVSNPVNVRFAWDETAQPNLFNRFGLPALPFRTKYR